MRCVICMQVRHRLKFQTGRISICRYCVQSINAATISPRSAGLRYLAKWRRTLIHFRPEAATWPLGWFERRIPEHMEQPDHVRHSLELRLLRAYRRRLVCLDRRYLAYPADWPRKRLFLKRADGFACHLCGVAEADDKALHVHHIIHRSHSGTNSKNNLVALCRRCHQLQHPDIVIGADHGEPDGVDPGQEVPPDEGIPPGQQMPGDGDPEEPRTPSFAPPAPPIQPPISVARPQAPAPAPIPAAPAAPVPQPPPTPHVPALRPPADTGSYKTTAFILLAVAIAGVAVITITPDPHLPSSAPERVQVFTAPAAPLPAAPASPVATPAAPEATPRSPPASAEEQWKLDTAAFIATRCELADMRPEVRTEVARNYRIFQRVLNEFHGKAWPNQQMLAVAGEQVYHDPAYTPRGHCPN